MRIHRLRVERVKGISASELTFPETGVVVIEGPNEVGKSTLLEALDRLLDPKAKASSRAASITSLQPVGQDVGPYVEAELSIGPYRLVFAKQWLKQPATTLQILVPEPEQLTGQDAQARMTSILDECLDRTLFDALRLAQAGSPGAIELGDSAVLEAALDAAAGAALHADEGAALLEAVEREYQRYYTAGTGRVSGELREAQAAVTEGEHRHEQAQHEVCEVEDVFGRRESLALEMASSGHHSQAATVRAQAAQTALAAVKALRAQEDAEQKSLLAAEQSHRRAVQDIETRQGLVGEAATRMAQVEQRRKRVVELATVRDRHSKALAASEEALLQAGEDYAEAQVEAETAATELAVARAETELAALADRIATAEEIVGDLGRSRANLEACAITAEVLDELRRTDAEVNIAQVRVEASATSIRVSAPDLGHSVDIADGTPTLDPGRDVIERLISSDVSLLVDSHVRIEIRPDAQARERVERRDALAGALAERLIELEVADLAEAEVEGDRRAQILARTTDLNRELAGALHGKELPELQDAYAAQAERCSGALDRITSSQALPGAVELAMERAESTRLALSQLSRLHADAQQTVDGARAQTALSTAAHEVMQAHHGSAVVEQERSAAALADARLIDSDEDVHGHARHAEELFGQAQNVLRQVRAALAAEGAQARENEARLAAAEQSRAIAHLQSIREDFFEVKGRLEQVAAEGRQEAAERADQALGDARRRYASVERRAVAAHQLRSTLQRHRDRAHESYAEPYARQIERLGQQVYGDSFGVSVSSDLVITHRSLHGNIVPFASLSGGAKEQLGILARLSVAALVAGQQSVPVVVDDALGYTDPQRLHSLSAVLAGGGGQGQLLLLTCTPDRYADIPGAHTIRMTA